MTTVQEPLVGPFSPPPCSAYIDPLPNEDHNNAVNPSAPQHANPDSARCRFLSSDKRQCRMLRADQHPDFCLYHAARQEEIFALLPEREFSLAPELEDLAADLTTATGVNRALGQVFRLLAQNRISRKDAVAFGYIAQLLLQTVPGVRAEAISAFGYKDWAQKLQSTLSPQPAGPAVSACAPPAPSTSPRTPPQSAKPETPACTAAAPIHSGAPANASAASVFSPPNSTIRPGSSSRATNGSEGTLRDAIAPPDYDSLLSRSLDLVDGKFDASPESQREARRLLNDLERLTPPRATASECALPQTRSQPAQNVHLQNEHPDRMFVPSDEPEPRDLSSRYRA